MKTADIKVGEDYAFAQDYEWRTSRYNRDQVAVKARVLETRLAMGRPYYRSLEPTGPKNGIKIEFEKHGSKQTKIVRSREIREEWASYAERRDAQNERKREANESLEQATETMRQRILAVLPDIDEAKLPEVRTSYNGEKSVYRPSFEWGQIAQMLEEAFEAGAAKMPEHIA